MGRSATGVTTPETEPKIFEHPDPLVESDPGWSVYLYRDEKTPNGKTTVRSKGVGRIRKGRRCSESGKKICWADFSFGEFRMTVTASSFDDIEKVLIEALGSIGWTVGRIDHG